MPRLLDRIRGAIRGTGDRNAIRIRRRRTISENIWRRLPTLRLLLLLVGYSWLLLLPSPMIGERTFIDENALHPGQVNTYWGWGDVHRADLYLAQLEALRDRNASSREVASYVSEEFQRLGLSSATQEYSYSTTLQTHTGTNAYGLFSSPRASGAEATLITASWLSSSGEGNLNLRGVSTVLALAAFLKGYSLWAKDFIFVISDGYLEGMQAFITTYYGESPSNLVAEPLKLPSGVIWVALNIDYPGHSFSHLGVFFEGINGRLPNQDLYNSFHIIARHTGGVPVALYDHLDSREHPYIPSDTSDIPSWVPPVIKNQPSVREYAYRTNNILRHVGYQARGRASGVHGLLHRFRIDAITMFAVPATGPHGFHALGRTVESTLRTVNNLLERLHASFFFYMLVNTTVFLKIGFFLPSVVILSVAMMFSGLHDWVNAAWYRTTAPENAEKQAREIWASRPRPVLKALLVMAATHLAGIVLFYLITSSWFVNNYNAFSPVIILAFALPPLVTLTLPSSNPTQVSPLWRVLKAFNLCLTSTVVSVTCVLNFSLAGTVAAILSIPLIISSPSSSISVRLAKYSLYTLVGLGWVVFGVEEVKSAIWQWDLMGVWFAPFVCMVYTPLVLQSAVVSVLPQ
ncbi:Gaa1-domain-containing protein [Cristinia sonorae]|uniref:Gaa1-domain-containing protein n=1 Tax=Cristinia sonorae TaxID=1940300 RepID=A0A8K0UXT8_9AGAR|nr:Gaa1-domain-containing protein [Cristinia sonorae]